MKGLSRKLIAVVLSVLMVVGVIPLTAIAEDIPQPQTEQNMASPGEEPALPAPILAEVTELRDSNVKHFRLEDGTYLAAQYDQPVHYEIGGEWKDIDNTLTLQPAQDGEDVEGFQNAQNPVQIKLAKHADSKKLVKIKQGQHQISWA